MIQIRKYTSADKSQLLQILNELVPKFFHYSEIEDFNSYLESDLDKYFVATYNRQIVGSGGINFGFNSGNTARISWDLISPDFQGMGFGRKLLQHRICEIRKQPEIKCIEVRTSQLVFPFYQKSGFQICEIIDDYWSLGLHLYRMELIF